jgi:uncharacterized protein (TIGR02284 family)
MADHNERWVLNHLIEMCRDEELSLRFAADHVKDQSVRSLLVELGSERARFAAELTSHVRRLGGTVASDGTMRGALHRRWLATRDALLGYGERDLIAEAENGEREALTTYEHALDDMLPPTTRDLVERQTAQLRTSYVRVRSLQPS